MKNCPKRYDIVIIDIFHFGNIPDYLMTKEFFQEVKGCLIPGGIMAMNSVQSTQNKDANQLLKATLLSAFQFVNRGKIFKTTIRNVPVFASDEQMDRTFSSEKKVPLIFSTMLKFSFNGIKQVTVKDFGVLPATDDNNPVSFAYAKTQLELNRYILKQVDYRWLIN